MKGDDALDLLNRLSTNSLENMAERETRDTLLCDNQGKLVDWLRVSLLETGGLRLITSESRAQAVVDWLEKFTIMEDSISEVVAESRPIWRCATSRAVAEQVEGAVPILRGFERGLDALDGLSAGLDALPELSPEEYERARIDVGVPDAAHEFLKPVNPLELRLGPIAVSFSKGCYVGQEVLSRMDSYDKIARLLMGWRSSEAVDLDDDSRLTASEKSIGRITSASFDRQCGLAIVKRTHASPARVGLRTGNRKWEVELVDLPFWSS